MDTISIQLLFQLVLAAILGGIIGLEREWKRREAGLQTYSLVTVGSCLFTIIGYEFFDFFGGMPSVVFDPSRIILAVATGIGFLGAGVIIYRESHVEGLTTAAGLWMTAALGIAVGAKLYILAFLGTLIAMLIFVVFGWLERKLFGRD